MEEGKTAKIVLAHSEEIREACQKYPAVAEQLEIFKKDIRCLFNEMNQDIRNIDGENDQTLVMMVIINNIHKLTDEIFLSVS